VSNETDVYGLPISKGSKLQSLARLQRSVDQTLGDRGIGWVLTEPQFWVQRAEPSLMPDQFVKWATQTLEDLDDNDLLVDQKDIVRVLKDLAEEASGYARKITATHRSLDKITTIFVELNPGHRGRLEQALVIAEASIFEKQPLAVAAKRFEELVDSMEAEERRDLSSHFAIEWPLDPKLLLELRGHLVELEIYAELVETSEASQ
jgi:hypothetical protein